MHCPDCGRESRDDEKYCPVCGYPVVRLRERLRDEDRVDLGWAEKILGKSPAAPEPPPEPSLVSFSSGEEPKPEKSTEEKGLLCERCNAHVEVGTLCPKCGDRLPVIGDDDPYISHVFGLAFRMLFAPRHFAITFPYPISGGTVQPLLYPGIFTAVFILTLPIARAIAWIGDANAVGVLVPTFVAFLLCILGLPLLVYLSAVLIHAVGTVLGGTGTYRRTIRIFSASLIWLSLLGIIRNLYLYAAYLARGELEPFIEVYVRPGDLFDRLHDRAPLFVVLALVFIGWQYSWMFGALYRLSWWKTVVHTAATYVALLWWIWIYIVIIIPLRAGGFL